MVAGMQLHFAMIIITSFSEFEPHSNLCGQICQGTLYEQA